MVTCSPFDYTRHIYTPAKRHADIARCRGYIGAMLEQKKIPLKQSIPERRQQ